MLKTTVLVVGAVVLCILPIVFLSLFYIYKPVIFKVIPPLSLGYYHLHVELIYQSTDLLLATERDEAELNMIIYLH